MASSLSKHIARKFVKTDTTVYVTETKKLFNNLKTRRKPTYAFSSKAEYKNDGENSNNEASYLTVAKMKNPIVEKLWSTRFQAKQMMEQNLKDFNLSSISAKSKHPNESETFIDYSFSTDEFLYESYRVRICLH